MDSSLEGKFVTKNNNVGYRLLKYLASGSFGAVFKGTRMVQGKQRYFAIKLFRNNSNARQDMKNEVASYQRVSKSPDCYKYVICMYDSFIDNRRGWGVVVLELMNGGDLNHYIWSKYRSGVPAKHLPNIMLELLKGLTWIHSKGMAHRDIKPGNIMREVRSDGSEIFKMADLGGGCMSQSRDTPPPPLCTAGGTPEFTSPEIARKFAEDNRRGIAYEIDVEEAQKGDVWSLGMVFWELTFGYKTVVPAPIDNSFVVVDQSDRNAMENFIATAEKIGMTTTVKTPNYKKDGPVISSLTINKILKSMLTIDPDQRPSAKTVLDYLENKMRKVCSYKNQSYSRSTLVDMMRSGTELGLFMLNNGITPNSSYEDMCISLHNYFIQRVPQAPPRKRVRQADQRLRQPPAREPREPTPPRRTQQPPAREPREPTPPRRTQQPPARIPKPQPRMRMRQKPQRVPGYKRRSATRQFFAQEFETKKSSPKKKTPPKPQPQPHIVPDEEIVQYAQRVVINNIPHNMCHCTPENIVSTARLILSQKESLPRDMIQYMKLKLLAPNFTIQKCIRCLYLAYIELAKAKGLVIPLNPDDLITDEEISENALNSGSCYKPDVPYTCNKGQITSIVKYIVKDANTSLPRDLSTYKAMRSYFTSENEKRCILCLYLSYRDLAIKKGFKDPGTPSEDIKQFQCVINSRGTRGEQLQKLAQSLGVPIGSNDKQTCKNVYSHILDNMANIQEFNDKVAARDIYLGLKLAAEYDIEHGIHPIKGVKSISGDQLEVIESILQMVQYRGLANIDANYLVQELNSARENIMKMQLQYAMFEGSEAERRVFVARLNKNLAINQRLIFYLTYVISELGKFPSYRKGGQQKGPPPHIPKDGSVKFQKADVTKQQCNDFMCKPDINIKSKKDLRAWAKKNHPDKKCAKAQNKQECLDQANKYFSENFPMIKGCSEKEFYCE
jgi:serine/threonine protein kinase